MSEGSIFLRTAVKESDSRTGRHQGPTPPLSTSIPAPTAGINGLFFLNRGGDTDTLQTQGEAELFASSFAVYSTFAPSIPLWSTAAAEAARGYPRPARWLG